MLFRQVDLLPLFSEFLLYLNPNPEYNLRLVQGKDYLYKGIEKLERFHSINVVAYNVKSVVISSGTHLITENINVFFFLV